MKKHELQEAREELQVIVGMLEATLGEAEGKVSAEMQGILQGTMATAAYRINNVLTGLSPPPEEYICSTCKKPTSNMPYQESEEVECEECFGKRADAARADLGLPKHFDEEDLALTAVSAAQKADYLDRREADYRDLMIDDPED